MTVNELYDLLCQTVRVGFVSVRDEAAMRVRVKFDDITGGAVVSDWLQVLTPRARADKQYDLPDEGDQVLCLFLPFGKECGFVLGSMYGAESPPVSSGDKWRRAFSDGSWLEYDRAAHRLTAVVVGDVDVSAGGSIKAVAAEDITAQAKRIEAEALEHIKTTAGVFIEMTAPTIYQNGNVVAAGQDGSSTGSSREKAHRIIDGSLTVNGPLNINGNSTISGNSSVAGNSYAATRSGGPI
jgi:phage baseplate assembly protein V